jgi:hypothetical protein
MFGRTASAARRLSSWPLGGSFFKVSLSRDKVEVP